MAKFTKKQIKYIKELVINEADKALHRGWYKGQIALLEDQRKMCLDSIDAGYESFSHTGIIENCNIGIKQRTELLNTPLKQNAIGSKE